MECVQRASGALLKTASGAPQTGPPSPPSQGLHAAGFEIISTGGTAASIEKAGVPVKKVNAVCTGGGASSFDMRLSILSACALAPDPCRPRSGGGCDGFPRDAGRARQDAAPRSARRHPRRARQQGREGTFPAPGIIVTWQSTPHTLLLLAVCDNEIWCSSPLPAYCNSYMTKDSLPLVFPPFLLRVATRGTWRPPPRSQYNSYMARGPPPTHSPTPLLAVRDHKGHMEAIAGHKIEPIDLVVVNLYPFRKTVTATPPPAFEVR